MDGRLGPRIILLEYRHHSSLERCLYMWKKNVSHHEVTKGYITSPVAFGHEQPEVGSTHLIDFKCCIQYEAKKDLIG